MQKVFLCLVLLLAAGCLTIHDYPIDLSYSPKIQPSAPEKGSVAVTRFRDRRSEEDKRVIGTRDGDSNFVLRSADAATAVSEAVARYLESRGFTVVMIKEVWDGSTEGLRPEWGESVIGGDIDQLEIRARTGMPKIEYASAVKLYVKAADPKSRKIVNQQRIEASSSYTTVVFSRDKAEELINESLAEAVERSLGALIGL